MIYLDNNATTPVDPRVLDSMLPYLGKYFGNPSSPCSAGREARRAVEKARSQVAEMLGACGDAIVFTSGGTESVNTAIRGALAAQPGKRHIVTSLVEHSAVKNLCERLGREGCEVTWLRVDTNGNPDLDEYRAALRNDTAIVSVVWANNETGVLFPVEEMARIADERRIVFHADAVQAAGKISINLARVSAHLLSISGHKFHGPKGAGALFVRPSIGLPPLLIGGGQESGRRAGTENVPGIVGFGFAAELAAAALPVEIPRVVAMRDKFEEGLRARFADVIIHGARACRLPNTSNFALPGLDARSLLAALDRLDVACSVGSACSSGSPDASHVLRAMHVNDDEARASLRFSFSRMNADGETDRALDALVQAVRRLAP